MSIRDHLRRYAHRLVVSGDGPEGAPWGLDYQFDDAGELRRLTIRKRDRVVADLDLGQIEALLDAAQKLVAAAALPQAGEDDTGGRQLRALALREALDVVQVAVIACGDAFPGLGPLMACSCGWRGKPRAMTPTPSGGLACPKCGGTGGVMLASSAPCPVTRGAHDYATEDGRLAANCQRCGGGGPGTFGEHLEEVARSTLLRGWPS